MYNLHKVEPARGERILYWGRQNEEKRSSCSISSGKRADENMRNRGGSV